ncbi:MAG TPA: tRNA (adenosine(37)-N6)-threonylcarbamoyltransferase complex dimerization subunit type 1 TsaB [Isosphaeraceae bacterium]|nr:tRNA (adenosine(37)-N6)-threonylcarbamoyltransferase complex dimerization subunit type 1 TsaB [Isosphaeraceae bacterium]
MDTSTPRAAIALGLEDGTVLVAPSADDRQHGRGLVPAIRDLLRAGGLGVAGLDAIAVGLGPGSYTGLRVGVTAAKTLAYAIGTPLVGLDSLEILAANAGEDVLRLSVVADAQRGDLFVADFAREGPGSPLLRVGSTRVEAASAWAARLTPGTLVIGPAVLRPGFAIPASALLPADPEAHRPDGRRLIPLARAALDAGRLVDPWFVEPVYLRRSAAEDQWDARSPAS